MSDASTVLAGPAARGESASEKSALERFPVQMFSLVMGTGGIGNAWRAGANVLGTPAWVSWALTSLAAALFVAVSVVYLAKLIRHSGAVAEEFMHPVKSNFFGAISVSAVILSIALRSDFQTIARVLWLGGATLHISLAVIFIRRWVLIQQDEAEMTPAWFIPIAGNFLVPVGGVPLGYVEASWFFFSVALVFWLVLFTIAMHRVVFCAPMTDRSVPTLFILLAPPSIGLSAYLSFTGGEAGALAHILYCFGLFVAVLIATLLNRFVRIHFFLSWWAMTFPSSAWATSTIVYYKAHPTVVTEVVAYVALAAASLIVCIVAARTLQAAFQGVLLKE